MHMKTCTSFILILVVLLCSQLRLSGQSGDYRNFPIIFSLQFHALSLPLKDLKSNFSHVGVGLGTEISFNGKHNWAQQFQAVWYPNKEIGQGWLFSTQSAWRPYLVRPVYGEIKLGAGYLWSSRPVDSFRQVEGRWQSVGHRGKGMFTIPLGITIGYQDYSPKTFVAPYASYQLLLVTKYNASVPLVPQTLLQLGSKIHL